MHRIVLAGGGTAGHVNPLLAVANAIRAKDPSADIAVIGTAVRPGARPGPAGGIRTGNHREGAVPSPPPIWPRCGSRWPGSGRRHRTRQILERHQAQVVVGFGRIRLRPGVRVGACHADPDSDPRAERARRHGQQAGRPLGPDYIGTAYEGTGLKARRDAVIERVGAPVAAGHRAAVRAAGIPTVRGARRQAAEQLGPGRESSGGGGDRRLAGAPPTSTAPWRPRPHRCCSTRRSCI